MISRRLVFFVLSPLRRILPNNPAILRSSRNSPDATALRRRRPNPGARWLPPRPSATPPIPRTMAPPARRLVMTAVHRTRPSGVEGPRAAAESSAWRDPHGMGDVILGHIVECARSGAPCWGCPGPGCRRGDVSGPARRGQIANSGIVRATPRATAGSRSGPARRPPPSWRAAFRRRAPGRRKAAGGSSASTRSRLRAGVVRLVEHDGSPAGPLHRLDVVVDSRAGREPIVGFIYQLSAISYQLSAFSFSYILSCTAHPMRSRAVVSCGGSTRRRRRARGGRRPALP